jgi:hypothetical protein
MTEETIDMTTDCPSAEDLCAWFDNQLSDAEIDNHVNSCPQCKSIIKSYKRIDRQIKENVERPTQRDMGILVRIKDGSMKEITGGRGDSWLTPIFMIKILLSCAVIAGLLATIFLLPKRGGNGKDRKPHKGIDIPPTVQIINKDDQAIMKLARDNAAAFETVDVLALGTNLEILDPISENAAPETYRAGLICMWSAEDPSNALRFFKALLAPKYHKALDEKILESSDYCTIILKLSSKEQRAQLNGLLKAIGCQHQGDSSVKTGSEANPNVRYSFIHKK